MQLSPAQIDGLPPEQKAQVLALQQQMVSLFFIAVHAKSIGYFGCKRNGPASLSAKYSLLYTSVCFSAACLTLLSVLCIYLSVKR